MRRRNYSNSTILNYESQINYFLTYFRDKEIRNLTQQEVKTYLIDRLTRQKITYSTQNVAINAIKMYFEIIYKRFIDIQELPRPRRERRLPNVLSKEDIESIISCITNFKNRLLISLFYGCGLRASEAIKLRKTDIDFDRKLIYVRRAKGKKDRIVPIPENLIDELRMQIRRDRKNEFLFQGQIKNNYTTRSAQSILRQAVLRSGITKRVTLHTLRHSYGTHLLESGTDLRIIQELMGHSSSKTTEIYTHVSNSLIGSVRSPFDSLNFHK